MTEHVHEWMVSYVRGVVFAICNALDEEGNATCRAELSPSEIDSRLNATERLSALDSAYLYARTAMLKDVPDNIKDALRAYADTLEGK